MNANELADLIGLCGDGGYNQDAATMLRQQQAEIEELKKFNKAILKKGGYPYPLLTDEEINKLWAESHEDGIAMQQGFTTQQHYFAHLILRKAQE